MAQLYRIPRDKNQIQISLKGGDPFHKWASLFFKNKRLNTFIPVHEAFLSFVQHTGMASTRLQFKRALANWCPRKGYILDPEELRNTSGRIIRKQEISLGKYKAVEMFFVATHQ